MSVLNAPALRTPRSTEHATALLEHYAATAAALASIEAGRSAAIASANKAADDHVLPLVQRLDKLKGVLEAWWKTAGAELAKGKRKSIALGGCNVGTRAAAAKLQFLGIDFAAGEDMAVLALRKVRGGKDLLKVAYSVDKAGTLTALDGPRGERLKLAGFGKTEPADGFFVKPVAQEGTVTEAAKG